MVTHHEHGVRTEQAIKDVHIFQRNLSSKLIGQFLMIAGVNVFVETVASYFNLSGKNIATIIFYSGVDRSIPVFHHFTEISQIFHNE